MRTTFLNTKNYDIAAGDGGTGIPMSLSDLTDPSYKAQEGSDADIAAKAAEEAKVATDKVVADAAAVQQSEGRNVDGSLKEGWTEVDGKLVAPEVDPADEGDGEADPEEFFADVNKLHGRELKVEWPDGVDPLSPEGVYHRDKVLMDTAVNDFETYLKKTDPRSYAYMLHRQAGGDDDSFLSSKIYTLPEYSDFKESADAQALIMKQDLVGKGVDAETAQMVVDRSIKDGNLFTKADAVYKGLQAQQVNELKEIEARNTAAEKEYTDNVNSLNQKLTTAVTDGKEMRFVVPDTEKQAFLQFVREKVEWDAGSKQFLLVQKVGEDLGKQMEAMYLLYKKGDLSGMIERKAQTQNVNRLRKVVDKSKQVTTGAADAGKKTTFVALGDL